MLLLNFWFSKFFWNKRKCIKSGKIKVLFKNHLFKTSDWTLFYSILASNISPCKTFSLTNFFYNTQIAYAIIAKILSTVILLPHSLLQPLYCGEHCQDLPPKASDAHRQLLPRASSQRVKHHFAFICLALHKTNTTIWCRKRSNCNTY